MILHCCRWYLHILLKMQKVCSSQLSETLIQVLFYVCYNHLQKSREKKQIVMATPMNTSLENTTVNAVNTVNARISARVLI